VKFMTTNSGNKKRRENRRGWPKENDDVRNEGGSGPETLLLHGQEDTGQKRKIGSGNPKPNTTEYERDKESISGKHKPCGILGRGVHR